MLSFPNGTIKGTLFHVLKTSEKSKLLKFFDDEYIKQFLGWHQKNVEQHPRREQHHLIHLLMELLPVAHQVTQYSYRS